MTQIDVQLPIMQAIACGIQAPNPHNTQAWKLRLTSDVEALLYIDERRLLPATDPPARQIHIGAGCFVETLAVGMSAQSYRTDVEYLPEGPYGLAEVGRKPVARITLRPDDSMTTDGSAHLAAAIRRRQTNRGAYRGPFLTDAEAGEIRARLARTPAGSRVEVKTLAAPAEMRPLLDIFQRAMEIEMTTRHLYEETRIWFRYDERQRQTHRDGLSIPQLGVNGPMRRVAEWTLGNGDPQRWFRPRNVRSALRSFRRGVESARGVILLETATNTQSDWLDVGRVVARLQLVLTTLGLTSQPNSQALQEYPEMTALQAELNQVLEIREPRKVQMALRVGRARRTYTAPRRDPQTLIIDTPWRQAVGAVTCASR